MRLNKCAPFLNHTKTHTSSELAKRLEVTVSSLFNDLQDTRSETFKISEYNQRYFQEKLQNLELELVRDMDVVSSVLCRFKKPLEDFVFVEYGGGIGLLSLMAKRLDVGTVIYNDIYDVSCKDAREIARMLGDEADHYVQGGIDQLVEFCARHQIKGDGIVSYDVIEHIYDIDDFCRKLHLISHEGTIMVHASATNIFFYPYVKAVSRTQIEAETMDREEQWGHKKRDCLLAYSNERRNIIKEYAPSLTGDEIKLIATNTRGLIRHDILKCVDRYREYKEFPKLIQHPTNTCDPHTGNWAEHLMNPYYLVEMLSHNSFDAKVRPRYWGHRNHFLENKIAGIADCMIRILPPDIGLYICPYYSIYAEYTDKSSDDMCKQHIYKFHRSAIWYIVLVLWEVFSRFRQSWLRKETTQSQKQY